MRTTRPPRPCAASMAARALKRACCWRRPTNAGSALSIEPSRARSTSDPGRSVERPRVVGARAHRDPLGAQARRLEVVAGRRVLALALHRDRIDDRPAVDPAHGREEGLAPEDVDRRGSRRRGGPRAAPSTTSRRGPATRSAWPVFWTGWSVLRWLRIGLCGQPSNGPEGEGPRAIETAWPAPGAALGDEQVPRAVELVEVRRLGELQPGARPQRPRLLERPPAARIQAHLLDLAADGLQAGAAELRVGQPAGALGVPREVRVDADGALHVDGSDHGPWASCAV